MNIESGTEFSHYRVLQPIGRGGMGTVYLALDLSLDRRVAVKFLDRTANPSEDPTVPHSEAHILAAQDHPAPVKVHEIGRFRDVPFIVMEYVDGTSLEELLESGVPLPEERAVEIALELCLGLAASHERGILHGDIKPANIKVDGQGRVRILDFGVARAFAASGERRDSDRAGTLAYMSPEHLQGGHEGPYSDLFSVGVLLYKMLTGRLPFEGTYDAEIVYAITNRAPTPLVHLRPGVSTHLAAIVERLLEKDPTARYQSAAEVARALSARAAPSPAPRRPVRSMARALSAALVLALLLVTYWLVWGPTSRHPISVGEPTTVAVLPFDNLGTEGDEYFSDGLTDAVTTELAQLGVCRVISRHSSMLYKHTTKNVSQVASELGADYLVTGSIHWTRAADDSVRLSVALVTPTTDAYLWSKNYSDRIDRIFAIQTSVAHDLAHTLAPEEAKAGTARPAAPPTANLAAYDYYLRGNEYFYRSWEKGDIEAARQLYRRAIAADSNFALAWAMLARAEASLFWERYDPSEDRCRDAFSAAHRSLALAPNVTEAHLALGYCYYHCQRDFEPALEEFELALARDPNQSDLWNAAAAVHRRQGRIDLSLAEFEQSLRLDPRSHLKAFDVGLTLGMLRRYREAEAYLERTTALAPDYALAWIYRIWLPILAEGDTLSARRMLKRAVQATDLTRSKYYWILCRILPPTAEALNAPRSASCDLASYYMYRSRLARHRSDSALSRSYADSARTLLESAVHTHPADAYCQSELGLALAASGDPEGALGHGQEAMRLLPDSREAFDAPFLILNMAEICVTVGQENQALDLLDSLFAIPGFASRAYLKLDFVWDALRQHPRFMALVAPPQDSSAADRP